MTRTGWPMFECSVGLAQAAPEEQPKSVPSAPKSRRRSKAAAEAVVVVAAAGVWIETSHDATCGHVTAFVPAAPVRGFAGYSRLIVSALDSPVRRIVWSAALRQAPAT